MKQNDLPLGFGMALAQNETAMKQFEALTNEQKEAVVNKTRKINSKNEMKCFVASLSEGTLNI